MFTSKVIKKFIENHSKFSECANSSNKCFFAICSNSSIINLAIRNKSIFINHEEAHDTVYEKATLPPLPLLWKVRGSNGSVIPRSQESLGVCAGWTPLLNLKSEMFSTLRLMDGLTLCGAPGWNLERGSFCIYKPVVNRKKNKSTNWSVCIIETKQAQVKTRIVN